FKYLDISVFDSSSFLFFRCKSHVSHISIATPAPAKTPLNPLANFAAPHGLNFIAVLKPTLPKPPLNKFLEAKIVLLFIPILDKAEIPFFACDFINVFSKESLKSNSALSLLFSEIIAEVVLSEYLSNKV